MGAPEEVAHERFTLRATRLNRAALEEAVVSQVRRLQLDHAIEDDERTWLRRDFVVRVTGTAEAVHEFSAWVASLRGGRGDTPWPMGA